MTEDEMVGWHHRLNGHEFEQTLGDPPVCPKGDQSWVFIGRTDVEVETPILWPPDVKS